MKINLSDWGDVVLVTWMALWFLVGVLGCAKTIDSIAKHRPAKSLIWQVFGALVLIGVITLFMMFVFPQLLFDWDFCYKREQCGN